MSYHVFFEMTSALGLSILLVIAEAAANVLTLINTFAIFRTMCRLAYVW